MKLRLYAFLVIFLPVILLMLNAVVAINAFEAAECTRSGEMLDPCFILGVDISGYVQTTYLTGFLAVFPIVFWMIPGVILWIIFEILNWFVKRNR